MYVDGPRFDVRIMAPYCIEQPFAREYPAGMFEEVFEKAKLRRAERNDLAPALPSKNET